MPTDEPRLPMYNFKPLAEAAWFVGTAVLTTVAQAFVTFDPAQITDWRLWAVGILAASVRAGAGAILSYLAGKGLGIGQ